MKFSFQQRWVCRTIAIASGKDREDMVKRLGAAHYIDSNAQNVVEDIVRYGGGEGVKVILATVPSGKAQVVKQ